MLDELQRCLGVDQAANPREPWWMEREVSRSGRAETLVSYLERAMTVLKSGDWVLQTFSSSNSRGTGLDSVCQTAGLHQLHSTSVSSLGFHSEAQLQRQPLRLIASGCALGRCLVCRHRGVLGQCCQVGPHDTCCAQPQGRYQQGGQGQTKENVKGGV